MFAESTFDSRELDNFAFASRKSPEYMHPRLVECGRCGLVYADPALSPDALAHAYRSADFDSSTETTLASQTYAKVFRSTIRKLPDLDGALDIGTGNGSFISELLALGFRNVVGVEPSVAPIQAAQPLVRHLIRNTVFQPADYLPKSMSLISCFQTLEHVWDPLATARNGLEILKPGGVFLTAVHDRKALSARILGRRSPIFDIEHLQLFSERSVRCLFERAGYSRIEVRPFWNRYPLHYWLRLLPIPKTIKLQVLDAIRKSGAGGVPVSLPAGNLAVVGFRSE